MSNRDVFVWAFLIRLKTSALNLLHVRGLYERMWTFHNEQKYFWSFILLCFSIQMTRFGNVLLFFFHFKTVTIFLNLMMTIQIIYLSCIYKKECNIDLLFIVTKYIVPSSGPILNYMYSKKKYTMIYINFNSDSVLNGITQHIIDINY